MRRSLCLSRPVSLCRLVYFPLCLNCLLRLPRGREGVLGADGRWLTSSPDVLAVAAAPAVVVSAVAAVVVVPVVAFETWQRQPLFCPHLCNTNIMQHNSN